MPNRRHRATRKRDYKAVPAGTTLYRYFGLDIDRLPFPNVEAWYLRLIARPAYREHVMVPFAELRGRLEY
jgi:glutathione S-transferase